MHAYVHDTDCNIIRSEGGLGYFRYSCTVSLTNGSLAIFIYSFDKKKEKNLYNRVSSHTTLTAPLMLIYMADET